MAYCSEEDLADASMGPSMSIDGVSAGREMAESIAAGFNGAVDEHRRSRWAQRGGPTPQAAASMGPSMSIDGVPKSLPDAEAVAALLQWGRR